MPRETINALKQRWLVNHHKCSLKGGSADVSSSTCVCWAFVCARHHARCGPCTGGHAPVADLSFVGSWVDTAVQPGQPPQHGFITLQQDGTYLGSGPPTQPAPQGAPFKLLFGSAVHGSWVRTSPTMATITGMSLYTDEQGHEIAFATYQDKVTLSADNKTLTGTFEAMLTDPAGKPAGTFAGSLTATRIKEGMHYGTPLATPAH